MLHEASRPCPLTSGLPAARGAKARCRVVKTQGALKATATCELPSRCPLHGHPGARERNAHARPLPATRPRHAAALASRPRRTTAPVVHLARPSPLTPQGAEGEASPSRRAARRASSTLGRRGGVEASESAPRPLASLCARSRVIPCDRSPSRCFEASAAAVSPCGRFEPPRPP